MKATPRLALVAHLAAVASLAAQSPVQIHRALDRLAAPELDVAALELLIDTGAPAVGPLLEQLEGAWRDPNAVQFPRILRALRAIGPPAVDACQPICAMLFDERMVDGSRAHRLRAELARTLAVLLAHVRQAAPKPRTITVPVRRLHELAAPLALEDFMLRFRLLRRLQLAADGAEAGWQSITFDSENLVDRLLAAERATSRDDLPALEALLAATDHPCEVEITVEHGATRSQFRTRLNQTPANSTVHAAASTAIARIAPEHEGAVRGLSRLVKNADDPRGRIRAALALGLHGAAAAPAVPQLISVLDDSDARLVAEAVTALGMIGVASDQVVRRIEFLTRDERSEIAARARAALTSLRSERG